LHCGPPRQAKAKESTKIATAAQGLIGELFRRSTDFVLISVRQWKRTRCVLVGTDEPEDEDERPDKPSPSNGDAAPSDAADPQAIVERMIPADVRSRYEVVSYRNAAVILAETQSREFNEVLDALRAFAITTAMIRKAGGNESEMPKLFSEKLRPLGWHETIIGADLNITLSWREEIRKSKKGKSITAEKTRIIKREKYLDGHKIDM